MKILVTDRYPTEVCERLRLELGADVVRAASLQPTAEELAGAEILMIRSRTRVDAKLLGRATDLKFVVTATSGFDHVDLKACEERHVAVSYTPNANAQSAAELTLLLLLGVLRKLPAVMKSQRSAVESSTRWKDALSAGHELQGKTVGIIGFGRVGRRFAHLLAGFSCRILAYDPYVDAETMRAANVEKCSLTEILRSSEVLSLHVPLTKETFKMMGGQNLSLLGSDSVLINASRGPVVNEQALVEALSTGQLAGAGLDVFENEPLSADSKLRVLENLLWTPHIGALTVEATANASGEAFEKVARFLHSGQVDDALPKSAPWLNI